MGGALSDGRSYPDMSPTNHPLDLFICISSGVVSKTKKINIALGKSCKNKRSRDELKCHTRSWGLII